MKGLLVVCNRSSIVDQNPLSAGNTTSAWEFKGQHYAINFSLTSSIRITEDVAMEIPTT